MPLVLASVVVGLVIAFISGIFRAPLSRMSVDVILRGAPLPWIIQVIPRAGHILWVQLAADTIFWVVISFAALTIIVYPFGTKH